MSAVGASNRAPYSESTIDKIQTVSDGASNTVVGHPSDQGLIDATLINEILDEASDSVIRERSHDRRLQTEASLERPGHVVFAASFINIEIASRPDSLVARIESQHDFTESNDVAPASFLRFRAQDHSWVASSFGTRTWIRARAARYADPASTNTGTSLPVHWRRKPVNAA